LSANLIVKREGNITLLLVHEPQLRNALSREVVSDLRAALLQLSQDKDVAVLIIGSALADVFVSGGNIRELRTLDGSTEGLGFATCMQVLFKSVEDFPRPVLAVINGYCLGAGAELAMAADLRIAADTAVLSSPQVGLGIIPGLGGGQRMIRLCGVGHARRQILTGERISAAEAFGLGLVEWVVPASQLWDAAMAMATKLANKPRLAVGLAREALNISSQARLEAGCAFEADQFGLAMADALFSQPVAGVLRSDGGGR
jgi:enoyl-CoA hydratase